MITSVEDLDKMIARMIVARHPEKLEELGIGVEYIASLLRPAIEVLRQDAMIQIEKYQELLRQTQENQKVIDSLKNEVFQKTIENRKLQARLDGLEGKAAPTPLRLPLPPSCRRRARTAACRHQRALSGSNVRSRSGKRATDPTVASPDIRAVPRSRPRFPTQPLNVPPGYAPNAGGS